MDNDCDGEVDEDTDADCSDLETCIDGACECRSANQCGSSCVDLTTDAENCGECGNVCPGACADGTCQACTDDETLCSESSDHDVCVDLTTNPNHCGECGNACSDGSTCRNGACDCSTGTELCEEICVDLLTDDTNCGECGNVCPELTFCFDGACECTFGGTLCGTECVDVESSLEHCGACSAVCEPLGPNEEATCSSGVCTVLCTEDAGDVDGDMANGCETAEVVASVALEDWPTAVAQDDTSIFWTAGVRILRLDKGSLLAAPIVEGLDNPQALAAKNGSVYWVEGTGIWTAESPSPTSTRLVIDVGDAVGAIAVDGDSVYFAAGDTVQRVSQAGGDAVPLVTSDHPVSSVAVADPYVVYVSRTESLAQAGVYLDAVFAVPTAGGSSDVVYRNSLYSVGQYLVSFGSRIAFRSDSAAIVCDLSDAPSEDNCVHSVGDSFASAFALNSFALFDNGSSSATGSGIWRQSPQSGERRRLLPASTTWLLADEDFLYFTLWNGATGGGTWQRVPVE